MEKLEVKFYDNITNEKIITIIGKPSTLLKDWYADCNICPSNDTIVKSAILNGKDIIKELKDNRIVGVVYFEDVMEHIESIDK